VQNSELLAADVGVPRRLWANRRRPRQFRSAANQTAAEKVAAVADTWVNYYKEKLAMKRHLVPGGTCEAHACFRTAGTCGHEGARQQQHRAVDLSNDSHYYRPQ